MDDAATKATIADIFAKTAYVLDPHSAVGVTAATRAAGDVHAPIVALACAHAAKFPEVVTAATGVHPALPPHMADLFERPERIVTLPNDLAAVQAFIRSKSQDRPELAESVGHLVKIGDDDVPSLLGLKVRRLPGAVLRRTRHEGGAIAGRIALP